MQSAGTRYGHKWAEESTLWAQESTLWAQEGAIGHKCKIYK